MKVVGVLFYLAALYYLGWYLVSGQIGSEIGFVNLVCTGSLFYLLATDKKPEKVWFSSKKFGYGWGLATTWQGWVVYAVFIPTIIYTAVSIDSHTHSVSDSLIGIIPTLGLLLGTLLAICYKYGEKPQWRWGRKDS
jgi:hypothetical protein